MAIAASGVILLSFLIPVVLPFFTKDEPLPNDFVLPSTSGGEVQLSEFADEQTYTVIVFTRAGDCPECLNQLTEYQSGYSTLQDEDAAMIAVSLDGAQATNTMASQLGLPFPVVYDGEPAAASYGLSGYLQADYSTVTLIVDDKLRALINPVGTKQDEVLPSSVLTQAVRSLDQ